LVSEAFHEALWVLRAQGGDPHALELLLRSVQPSLRRFIATLVGPADTDDVLQESLIRVYRKLGQLAVPELFRAWSFRIAKRVALRHAKSQTRWLDEADMTPRLEDIPAPDAPPTKESLDELLLAGRVSPASRAVLVLHFQEGLSLPEVAAALELPLGTVKSRLGYGLSPLRRNLSATRSD
jgi:RNA polymerase sigma-70 factor (ECF subfamily)